MNKKISLSLGCVLALGISAFGVDLGEVSVTATKTERKVADVPASIEIITEEDIKKSVATTTNELLKNIAGVDIRSNSSVVSNSGAGTNKVLMRGFGGTASGRVLVMVDGVTMNDAMSQNIEWNKIAVEDVARIEVVKGANSALYGSSAMGGVINIITKKPKEQKTDISLTYGSMNTKIGSVSTTGKIDKVGYFVSGTRTKSDGYIKETLPTTKTIKTGIERDNVIGKLTYDIDDSSDLYFNFNYFDNQQLGEVNIPNYDAFWQNDKTYKMGYKNKLSNEIEISANIYKTIEARSYDTKSSTAVTGITTTDLNRLGGGIQATIPIGETQFITTGLDVRTDKLDNKSVSTTNVIIQNLGTQNYSALFLQDEIFLDNKTIINLGGRYDKYENKDGTQFQSNLTPATTNYPSKEFSAFNPKIGIVYNISKQTSLRTSIGKAFRVPTLYELYSTFYGTQTWYSNPNLEPEKTTSYELGLDQRIFEKGKISFTAYRSDATNFIYSATRPDKNYDKVNIGKVEIEGIETELFLPITEQLEFSADYTYNKSKVKEFTQNTALEGKYLTNIPKEKASANLIYTNPNLVNITAGVRYTGDRYYDDANTESKAWQSYTLYDLKISKKITQNSELSISVDDLFDKGYTETYVSPGRVVMATLKMSF